MPRKRDITMLKVNKQKFLIAIGNAGKTLQELSEESKVGYSTICSNASRDIYEAVENRESMQVIGRES